MDDRVFLMMGVDSNLARKPESGPGDLVQEKYGRRKTTAEPNPFGLFEIQEGGAGGPGFQLKGRSRPGQQRGSEGVTL